jgi:hypothetical protein
MLAVKWAMTPRSVLLLCALLSGCGPRSVTPPPPQGPATGKFLTYSNSQLDLIPGSYVVVFDSTVVPRKSVSRLARSLVRGTGGVVDYVFTRSFRGFAAKNLTDAWASQVSARADVSWVRKDFRIAGKELRGGPFAPVPWNLDRVDQRAPLAMDRDYRFKTGPVGTAPPVPIYVLDNGVYASHAEFAVTGGGSRVENVADLTTTNPTLKFARCTLPVADGNHGTRVASIAAGAKFGITPTLIKNIKVLDRSPLGNSCTGGSAATVAMGLDATLNHMVSRGITKAVVNLSLGWYASPVPPDIKMAVSNLQTGGALIVAAGGNENQDAAGLTPANLPGVLAVGATTSSDARLVFSQTNASNFGATIGLWAPGYSITAADWPTMPTTNATSIGSGTSEAAPHVAGAAALLWQQNPNSTPSQVKDLLRARATLNMLTNLGPGSTNALLYVGEDAPVKGSAHLMSRGGNSGDLLAVRVANDWRRFYVAGGDGGPFAYAGYDLQNSSAGPVWTVASGAAPANLGCVDIHAISASITSPTPGSFAYFGCMGTHNGAPEGVVIATQEDNLTIPNWQPVWLGAGSVLRSITAGEAYGPAGLQVMVFAMGTRATATGSEVFITALDGYDGHLVKSIVLTGTGFSQQFHSAVDLVLVENAGANPSTDLVAATYSDPPGPDATFLWRLEPQTLVVKEWRELPVPALALNGTFATALAVQALEDNGSGIVIPGEVFLATTTAVSDGGHTVPWAYIYRLNPDRVTVHSTIDVVKEANISSLWSEDGDLYFAGTTTRTFPPGSLNGIPKPGPSPSYDAFIGKSEGVINRRRWMVTFNQTTQSNSGHGGYGAKKAYLVGSDANNFYVVDFPVY